MSEKISKSSPDFSIQGSLGRRDFLRYSLSSFAMVSTGVTHLNCLASNPAQTYPIDTNVKPTTERMVSFPYDLQGLAANEIDQVTKYDDFGYGAWTFGAGLPIVPRFDLMLSDDSHPTPTRRHKFARFFTFSDIHITDKEAPNQFMLLQEFERYAINNTSIYSPVMMYTTQVLDAAMQTMNALHQITPFDFALSLGDTCNSTSYNELRWYMDVIDGKLIRPSSGAHLGADSIDYQKPFQAVGLHKSIPWYQTIGNHDHFMIGSFPVDADPSLSFRKSYVADTVWAVADILKPNTDTYPVLFNMQDFKAFPRYYMGVMDGNNPWGKVIHTGVSTSPKFANGAPKVVADPDRRSLLRTDWIQEFFNTSSSPVGHGFHLVDKSAPAGFACYSFVPKSDVPLKVIVLDDTQSENDGSKDIHGHGYLDKARWAWLKAELAAGQQANQLMVIAAHIPIGVAAIGSEMEWWLNDIQMASATAAKPQWWLNEPPVAPEHRNATTLTELVETLQNTPNLILWLAGHRHFNTIKAFPSRDTAQPEKGFWQVETSSLRDFPQQLRTFEIYLNSDYSISIVTVNVDVAVAPDTPAATSRKYAIAVQQIVQNDLLNNAPNPATMTHGGVALQLPTIDPTRPQSGDMGTKAGLGQDPSIQFTDLKKQGVPYNASYNAELFKPLSPTMVAALRARFPEEGVSTFV